MELIRRVRAMRECSRRLRERGVRVGFVPTMGDLHAGHASLIRHVREQCGATVVSVFVNPTQFGPGEDYERYPRDLAKDADCCVAERVDYLFAPDVDELYPTDASTFVEVTGLSDRLEGRSRPGHFRGVCTVVTKLLNVVQPSLAGFGQKDAQQAAIVRRMVRDLMLDLELVVLPTMREADGLALSSRNRYLSAEERRAAVAIPRALEAARHVVAQGLHRPEEVVQAAREVLDAEPLLMVDYVELVDAASFDTVASLTGELLLLIAVYAGATRLIDNTELRVAPL
ncbi:MAG TPA: pantoate--beta-alanine ligase [Candidatus Polarisedimenticolaceae bacterium]|nr:pantoate--beta-alanine ligase [Candidatus Polarisedimenticolaceae bacterium]